jgi:hypothetical protein
VYCPVVSDGTTHIVYTPHELIEKLIPLIPRPRCHLVRYHGILGPAAKDRAKVVPTPPALPAPDTAGADSAGADKAGIDESRDIDITKMPRINRLPWAVLLKRVFMTDALTCPKCNGRMKILAAITNPEAVRKILDHLGLPSDAPPHRRAPSATDRLFGHGRPRQVRLRRPAQRRVVADRPPNAGPG